MRRLFRLAGILSVCLGCLFAASLIQTVLARASAARCGRVFAGLTQVWAQALLWLLNLRIELAAPLPAARNQNYLLISNHQSYLDILILAAVCPTQFVAKAEVRRWPLLGWLAAAGGTLFVERENTHSSVRCVYRVSRALRAGLSVMVFPEGTTSDGTRVLPFKPLLAAAKRARTPVWPLTIHYSHVNGAPVDETTRARLCWYGEMDFVRHFWHLLSLRAATAVLVAHEPVWPPHLLPARELAQVTQTIIGNEFIGLNRPQTGCNEAWPFGSPDEYQLVAVSPASAQGEH